MMAVQNKMVFCTLFDSNYLDKGLALYCSMRRHISCFRLYIFTFDDKCYEVLSDMRLKNVVLVPLEDIMTEKLKQLKAERTHAEFCFTCTPVVIEYVLSECQETICTYLDADIYFFASPMNAIQEVFDKKCSVGLTKHGFERNYDYARQIFRVGKYCIEFNTFINDQGGRQVLREWKEDCLQWCYYRCEDGKFGDQKYPDKWKLKYSCVHDFQEQGIGIAPWNLHLFTYIGHKNEEIQMKRRDSQFSLIFYHFEGMKYLNKKKIFLNLWRASEEGTRKKVKLLYGTYIRELEKIRRYLERSYRVTFEHMIVDEKSFSRKKYSLKHFCEKYGLLVGLNIWTGFWLNNVSSIKRLCRENRRSRVCFCRKEQRRYRRHK